MPRINGIIETALTVGNLQESAEFYRRLFGFDTLLDTERLIALNIAGRNVLLLFPKGGTSEPVSTPGGLIPAHDGAGMSHLAFSIDSEQIPLWKERLNSSGISIESEVTWPGGAQSIYFRDPDRHLLELITPGFWRIY